MALYCRPEYVARVVDLFGSVFARVGLLDSARIPFRGGASVEGGTIIG